MSKKFIKLTTPNGEASYIATETIIRVARSVTGDPRANAEISVIGGGKFFVRETSEDIVKLLQEDDK